MGTPVSSTNKTYLHDIAEILLKVVLNAITQTPQILPEMSLGWFSTFCMISVSFSN
jgi:hypothetical protein